MKLPADIKVFGDTKYRNKKCPSESAEQVTFVNYVRRNFPDTFGKTLIHVRNEGSRTWGQAAWQKAEGMSPGAPDIIIPANIPFLCEMKRRDHTLSKVQQDQTEYMRIAQNNGCFCCFALGFDGAVSAFTEWRQNAIS